MNSTDTPVLIMITRRSVIIYAVELLILTTGLVYCSLFLAIVLKVRCFHQNLRILLVNFATAYMVEIISRYMIVIPLMHTYILGYASPLDTFPWCRLAHFVHDMTIAVIFMDTVVLVVERSIATRNSRTYELSSSSFIGVSLVVAQWSLAFVFIWLNQAYDNTDEKTDFVLSAACQKMYLNTQLFTVLAILSIIVDVIVAVVFIILLRINRRKYDENRKESGNYLSNRYQTAENIRSTRLLYPLMTAKVIVSLASAGLLLTAGLVLAVSKDTVAKTQTASILGQSFDLLIATYTVIFPQLAFYGQRSLLWASKKSILCVRRKAVQDVKSAAQNIRGVDGKPLLNDIKKEFDDHFAALEALWNK
ncbi:serpentine type 7TM GPCR receptor class ab chemoreceptor domain-containing protein [Ditylenchus destructor]|uniref:Serpentine type 7TM GPCR receptor class ab chemoreceptor domain-containing protein n=1 Tax=Ditylenchus destructor TaxID=166010 RepID=A0AAD4MLK7_9BILA|nr:serpentine type 7TM GPCR receptor class ab chemoreceptor domain-containing protein [Ditylenchus destructor]